MIKLTKALLYSLTVISILSLNQLNVNAEWKQDSNGWWNTDGDSYSIGWKEIDGKWYYFYPNGYMAHDTIINGYTLNSDGSWIQSAKIAQNSESKITTSTATTTSQVKSDSEEITINTEKELYNLGTIKFNFNFTNHTSYVIGFETQYTVEKLEDNKWVVLASDEEFIDSFCYINPKTTESETCNLSKLKDFRTLTPGKYRLVKKIYCYPNATDALTQSLKGYNTNSQKSLTAEFELN